MKHLTLLLSLLLAVAITSCDKTAEPKKEQENKKVFRLDPNAMVNIKPNLKGWQKAPHTAQAKAQNPKHLSPLEIVKIAQLTYRHEKIYGDQTLARGFADHQRDTLSNPPMLKMYGTDIIDQDGLFQNEFIEGTDILLTTDSRLLTTDDRLGDTIGYIPNAVLRKAEKDIKIAYANKDNEEVYRLFNEAFTFLPITGEEWRKLREKGLN